MTQIPATPDSSDEIYPTYDTASQITHELNSAPIREPSEIESLEELGISVSMDNSLAGEINRGIDSAQKCEEERHRAIREENIKKQKAVFLAPRAEDLLLDNPNLLRMRAYSSGKSSDFAQ